MTEQPHDAPHLPEEFLTLPSEPAAAAPLAVLRAVVGIGGSAGALDGYERFFLSVPATDSPLAYLVMPHQDPLHRGMMPELLQRCTSLPVQEAEDGLTLRPGQVYVCPPDFGMTVEGGVLRLHPGLLHPDQALPIDRLFESLALDQGRRAVAVVLSGMGQDGSQGVRSVRQQGGLVLVQDPATAEYPSMPASAVATRAAHQVLPAEELGTRLPGLVDRRPAAAEVLELDERRLTAGLQSILLLIHAQTGHDFTQYKQSTIVRRITRRMQMHGLESLTQYVRYLRETPGEVQALDKDLTINVTSFFRDPDAFASLREQLRQMLLARRPGPPGTGPPETGNPAPAGPLPTDQLPAVLPPASPRTEGQPDNLMQPASLISPESHDVFRVWTPGCATGEEAYSVAITLSELLHELGLARTVRVQIFATDIDEDSVTVARAGSYPRHIAYMVSPERLARYFSEDGERYVVRPELREMVIFALHNTYSDPPFTRLDLLCCRNMLIYLNSDLQRQLMPVFHYALRPGGLLFLGPSETIGPLQELFTPVDAQWKLFRRSAGAVQPLGLPAGGLSAGGRLAGASVMRLPNLGAASRVPPAPPTREVEITQLVTSLLLSDYTPPSVVVTPGGEIVHVVGRTAPFLELVPGRVGTNVLEMVRSELRYELSGAIRTALAEHHEVIRRDLPLEIGGAARRLDLSVRPLHLPRLDHPLLLVVFSLSVTPALALPEPDAERVTLIRELERDLQVSKEYLQANLNEMEVAVEQLRGTNEELQTSNEELQSTNEELMTSKEELQSLNEELITINAEHQLIITDLAQANDDMRNLLDSVGIATVFLDNEMRIKRFTPRITAVINLIPSDIGRPLTHLVTNLRSENLQHDVAEVLRTLSAIETEVQTRGGDWYLMKIAPYRTSENFIDGVVVVFTSITAIKRLEQQLSVSTLYADEAVNALPDPFIVLDSELRVVSANRAFYGLMRLTPERARGQDLAQLGGPQTFQPLLGLLQGVAQGGSLSDHTTDFAVPMVGRRRMKVTARHLLSADGHTGLVLLTLEDVTRLLEQAERRGEDRHQQAADAAAGGDGTQHERRDPE